MLALLASCLVVQLAVPLATLPRHLSWDYGEGWNAYWAARAMAGQPIYTSAASTITNNYPPLSFFVAGWVGRVVGDGIIGGRLLSLLSLGVCLALMATLARRLGGSAGWAWAGAFGFLLYIGSFAWRYIGTDDPQWPAAALSLSGLLLLVPAGGQWPNRLRIAAACGLMVLAGLLKHNQLAEPIAATLWLGRHPRHGLWVWLGSAALLVAAVLLALWWGFGPILFEQVLGHQRVFQARFFINSVRTLSGLFPEIGLAVYLWRVTPRETRAPGLTLVLLFAAIALILGVLERFGTGVSTNAHFDAAIAFGILGAVAFGTPGLWRSARAHRRMAMVALAPLLVATVVQLPNMTHRFLQIGQTEAQWREAIQLVREAPGPAACELPALCYWAGRPFLVDFYNYGQKLRKSGDPAALMEQFEERRFAVVTLAETRRFRTTQARLPLNYNQAIARNYRPIMALPEHGLLLVPRSGSAAVSG